MIPFVAPVDDILFSLRHVAGAGRLTSWDGDLGADILGHYATLAQDVIAPTNAIGDAQGARLENGRVFMPDGFADAYEQITEGGWQGLTAPEPYGGMGVSPVTALGVYEIFAGANHSMQMVCNLVPGAINTLLKFGSDDQKQRWIPKLASGEVLSTMCLTEAGAGSDLSSIRCAATPDGDGWSITGEKIFISGGDQDLSKGILHLVLARSGTKEDGLSGLSLFACPAQPGVRVERIEEKMGLHASPTCQMMFDGAKAELVGDAGAGLKAMFTLMNHARIDVALQGVAHAARAFDIADAYAADRTQGRKADGGPAKLADHADVRRMLDAQRILALSGRAMCHIALVEMELGKRPELAEFLTPLCKVFGSEAGTQSADLGIQVLGGYGYLREYGVEQIWRDARVTAIYEGANGIHARSLATRALRPGGGADAFADLVAQMAGAHKGAAALLAQWQGMAEQVRGAKNALHMARAFLDLSARVLEAAIWVRVDEVASHHRDAEDLRRLAQIVLSRA